MSSGIPQSVRELVWTRDGSDCARCGRSVVNFPSSIHHRLPRRMGGTKDPRINDPRNLVRLCGSATTPGACHPWVESHRDEAREKGWLIRSFDDLDQQLITIYGTGITLHPNGSRSDVWPFDDAPIEQAGLL